MYGKSFYPLCSAATLDIVLSWNAWRSLKFTQILRYLLKFAVAVVWAVVLPIGYSSSMQNPTGLLKFFSSWTRDWRNQSFYNYAVAIYMAPNLLAAVLFFLPPLRRHIERSNWRIVTLFMWWAQARIFCYGLNKVHVLLWFDRLFFFVFKLGSYDSSFWPYCSQNCMSEEECMRTSSHCWSKGKRIFIRCLFFIIWERHCMCVVNSLRGFAILLLVSTHMSLHFFLLASHQSLLWIWFLVVFFLIWQIYPFVWSDIHCSGSCC